MSQFNTSLVSVIRDFVGLQSASWHSSDGEAEGAGLGPGGQREEPC